SSAADGRSLARTAPALPRRSHVLHRRGIAQSVQRGRQGALSIDAIAGSPVCPAQRTSLCTRLPTACPVAASRGAVLARQRIGESLSGFLLTQMLLGLGLASAGTVVAAATNSPGPVHTSH